MQNVHFFILKGQCHEIFFFGFFMHHLPPSPWKIRGDIHKSRCTTGVNDTGSKFDTDVNDTGVKFSAGVNYTGTP